MTDRYGLVLFALFFIDFCVIVVADRLGYVTPVEHWVMLIALTVWFRVGTERE